MGVKNASGRLFRALAAAAAVLVAFAASAGSAAAKSRPLFGEVQGQVSARGAQRRTEVRGRRVKVDMSAVAGPDSPDGAAGVELNLFADTTLEAVKSRFQRRDDRHFTWFGKVTGDPLSTVVLVAGDGQMQGLIFAHGKHFSVQGGGAASQEVLEIDQSAFPKENCDQAPAGDAAPTAPALPSYQDVLADSGSTIDVLVVYTAAARSAVGDQTDMLNLAQLAIDTTNASYVNSFITPRLNLAHAEEISYAESGNWNTDLTRLSGTGDGFMNNVHTLRNTYRADVVVLLIDDPSSCGIAYLSATAASAFAVVAWDCAVDNSSFGHEIGHLQGARHDWYVDSTPGYNHGDIDLGSRQRTVMAYNNQCADTPPGDYCTRLLYWSNPEVFYPGTATMMGTLARENNARVLNDSAYTVANFVLTSVQLSVQSAYPATGISIETISPADLDGTSSGTTPFTLSYNPNTSVTLTAPATNGAGFPFMGWSGCTSTGGVDGTECAVTLGGNRTVTANYDTVPTLKAIANRTINEDAGLQKVALSGITAGDGQSQPLEVTAVSSDTSLIPNPTVVYTSPNTTGGLRFTPVANAFGAATVTVTVRDGPLPINVFERSFVVTVRAVNDAPGFVKGPNQAVLENVGAQVVPGWATDVSAGPANESAQTLTFVTANDKPGLFSVQPAVAADGTLTYAPAANKYGAAKVTVRLRDDGGTANGGVNASGAKRFTITVNDPPTLDAIGDVTINEDAGKTTVALKGISAGGGERQPLTVTAVAVNDPANPGLIPKPTVSYTSPNTTGRLSFVPKKNASGTATVAVTVNDGRKGNNTVVREFHVTVNAVNDAPSFVKGANKTVLEDAGAKTVVGWATSIRAGPANESAQTLLFTTTNNNNPLFSSPPAVAADGTLTFTPAADAYGSATVAVQLHDDGGTANGGSDASGTQTFKITVTAVAEPGDAPLSAGDALPPGPDFVGVVQTATTAAELQAALEVAGANGEHDIIRLAGGTYAVSANGGEHFAYSSTENKDLVIEGGWTPDFGQRAFNIPTELKNDVQVTVAGSGGVLEVTAGGGVALSGILVSGGQAAGSGGGASIAAAGTVVVGNCRILNNTAGGDGGGLSLVSTGGDVRLYGSTIGGNRGASGGGGLIRALSATVFGNEISGNEAAATDGGIQASVISGGSLIVSSNTIYGNRAPAGSSGLSVTATGSRGMSVLDVQNNIVYGNGAAPNFVVAPDSDCELNFLDLNIVNNNIACYEMCPEYLLDGSNTSVDFSGRAAGTFRLSAADAALIDQGSPYAMPLEDIEGDEIPLAGPGGADAVPDIGADEYNPENIAGPASLSVSASGNITAADGTVTLTVALDTPAKRDLVVYLNSGDAGVVSLTASYLRILKGSGSARTVVQAASGATSGVSTLTATDPSGRIAPGSVNVTVDIAE